MAATERFTLVDDQTKAMIFEGLNLSQLGTAFRMDHRVLVEKLHGVPPSGKRNGVNVWTIHDAAPHLVRPIYDIEAYIKRMHHNDLPARLTKEFWNGQKAKQDFEEKQGDLWRTAEVIEKVGELMKLVSMSARIATDTVERNTDLTSVQREALKRIMREMLGDLQRKVEKNFKSKAADDEEI